MSEAGEQLHGEALRRLLAVARELSASADLRQILSVIIDAMRDLLLADRATVFEYDATTDELFTTVAHGLTPDGTTPPEIRFPCSAGLAGEAARTRTIINVPDAHEDPRFNPAIDRKTGYRTRSLLTIPLEGFEDDLVGVAQVLNKRAGPFTKTDEEIAAALAAHAAVALKRGRLIEDRVMREKLERDLQLARQIQQSSFPSILPRLAGFDLAAWSEPAEQTGGDTYDLVGFRTQCAETLVAPELQGKEADQAVLLIADATGHGVGPALSVTQVRSMLRMAVRMKAGLAQIAMHMNRQLCSDLPPGRFITAWLGLLDAETHTLTSFSAGQGPLLHYRAASDDFVMPPVDTIPMGILSDLDVAIAPGLSFAPGDVFAAISDGIFEAMAPDSSHFDVQRTQAAIREARGGTAEEIITSLRTAVARFTRGRPADDDRTVIVVKRASG